MVEVLTTTIKVMVDLPQVITALLPVLLEANAVVRIFCLLIDDDFFTGCFVVTKEWGINIIILFVITDLEKIL